MLNLVRLVAAVVVAGVVAAVPSTAVAQQNGSKAPKQASLIVKFAPGLAANEHAAIIARNGGARSASIPALGLHVIEVPAARLADASGSLDGAEEAARSEVPAARLGRPEEYGDLVAFLCSERAAYITGAVIPIDGGLLHSAF